MARHKYWSQHNSPGFSRQAMCKLVVKLGSVPAPLSAPSHYIDSCVSNLQE